MVTFTPTASWGQVSRTRLLHPVDYVSRCISHLEYAFNTHSSSSEARCRIRCVLNVCVCVCAYCVCLLACSKRWWWQRMYWLSSELRVGDTGALVKIRGTCSKHPDMMSRQNSLLVLRCDKHKSWVFCVSMFTTDLPSLEYILFGMESLNLQTEIAAHVLNPDQDCQE